MKQCVQIDSADVLEVGFITFESTLMICLAGGDDSILYGTDGIRWFYSIVHVSSLSQVVGVLK